ncbi:hypothetical protein V8G54_004172 [Vigna mungo]|uniref:Uncharacterized protein n=1 Tax=Vigna mungo TaxID=3915 RepID=A0AAQ3PFP1_VIGMU
MKISPLAAATILAIIDTAEHLEVNTAVVFRLVSNRPERSKPNDMEEMNSKALKNLGTLELIWHPTLSANSLLSNSQVLSSICISAECGGIVSRFAGVYSSTKCGEKVSDAGLVGMRYGNVTSGGGGTAATWCVRPVVPVHNHNPFVNPAIGFVHAPSFTNRVGAVGGNVVDVSSSFVASTHGSNEQGVNDLVQKMVSTFGQHVVIKYQLPDEDLDALVSVSCPLLMKLGNLGIVWTF